MLCSKLEDRHEVQRIEIEIYIARNTTRPGWLKVEVEAAGRDIKAHYASIRQRHRLQVMRENKGFKQETYSSVRVERNGC